MLCPLECGLSWHEGAIAVVVTNTPLGLLVILTLPIASLPSRRSREGTADP